MFRLKIFAVIFIFYAVFLIAAQESVGNYQVIVAPDRDDWTYKIGQTAKFDVSVTLNKRQVSGVPIEYSCGLEMMPPRLVKKTVTTSQKFTIDAGTLKEPGFLRCIVTFENNGKTYRGLATAGFRPDLIEPTTTDPPDFDEFWNEGKAQLNKLPLDAKIRFLPDYSTPKVDVYEVSFQNIGAVLNKTSRIYGILAIPKSKNPDQKFPAILNIPGAGVRPYRGSLALAEKGFITLQIGIHGIPVTLDQTVYDDLAAGALNLYMSYNLDNRDTFYFRRVILGCLRANDFLESLPQFDGVNLGVMGGSQGGGLSIATAALDQRVKTLAVWIPALADMTGYIYGRAGGWSHAFKNPQNRTKDKIETSKYYDAVNFARRIKIPGIYTFGYNDETCPPTSMFSAYNTVVAPKTLVLALETGHSLTDEQNERVSNWLEDKLNVKINNFR